MRKMQFVTKYQPLFSASDSAIDLLSEPIEKMTQNDHITLHCYDFRLKMIHISLSDSIRLSEFESMYNIIFSFSTFIYSLRMSQRGAKKQIELNDYILHGFEVSFMNCMGF